MNPYLTAVLSVFGTLMAAAVGIAVAMMTRASQRETRTIADLRADIVVLKLERDEQHVASLLATDYAHLCRSAIVQLGGTPPEWPEGLKT